VEGLTRISHRGATAAAPSLSAREDEWLHSTPRYELKFVGPARRGHAVELSLAALCRPDSEFPENRVHTLYFDSPRLRAYADKINGDYVKEKVRLRWYDAGVPETVHKLAPETRTATAELSSTPSAWLEIKAKTGTLGYKLRKRIAFHLPATATEFSPQAASDLLAAHLGAPLLPTCWLSYSRLRLVSLDHHTRVALDREIRVEWSDARLGRPHPKAALPCFVIEVKGKSLLCDPALNACIGRFARRNAFSKYAMCIDSIRGRKI